MIVIVMGVSGCGKTTIGRQLAAHFAWDFLDADDFHPPANVAKMRAGTPLTDADRTGWLSVLRQEIASRLTADQSAVLACSALREAHRRELRRRGEPIQFIYLRGDFATIQSRLSGRQGHYMPATLLASQFDALEEPTDAIVIPVEFSPADAVLKIVRALNHAAPVSTDARETSPPRSHGP